MSGTEEPEVRTGLEARSQAVFDASASELNARVRSRLTQARFAAVAELEHKRRPRWQRLWLPAAGMAAAMLLVAVIVVPGMDRTGQVNTKLAADDDIPILLDTDNIEMLENMEFYAWLDDDALDDTAAQPDSSQPVEPGRS